MINDIRNLSRDEKKSMVLSDINFKLISAQRFISSDQSIDNYNISAFLEKTIDRIYYITEKPQFSFIDKTLSCSTYVGESMDDLISGFLEMTQEKYFIFYNIWKQESIDGINYLFRGVYVDDPIIQRDKKIDSIINDPK
jgi:hypothetical protein